jgi:Fic family protein
MATSLDRVDILAEQLKKLLPMKPEDQERLDKKFRLEFNYNSNHMEGNTLTYGETELLLIFDDTTGNHTMREYEEMKAHDVAYHLMEEWAKDKERPLTEQNIKNLNEIILVRPFWKDAITPDGQATKRQIKVGDYKDYPNSVRLQNGEIFEYAKPSETPMLMQELIDWHRNEENGLHPVTLAAMLHYKFVRIHPFDDGNGRVSRLLMNYILLRSGLPPVVIKSNDKANYLRALNRADIGDYEAFIEYIAEQAVWTLQMSIKAAKGESIDEPGDLNKKLAQLKRKIGQDAYKKVDVKYSNDIVRIIADNVIEPLTIAWEEKLREFDAFFFSRSVHIIAPGTGKKGTSLVDAFNQFRIDQLPKRLMAPESIVDIKLSIDYQRLRSTGNNTSYNGGEVRFIFHQNAYEVEYTGSNKNISRLYNQSLTDIEIRMIVETVGNWFFANIEKAIEDAGK